MPALELRSREQEDSLELRKAIYSKDALKNET